MFVPKLDLTKLKTGFDPTALEEERPEHFAMSMRFHASVLEVLTSNWKMDWARE